MNPTYITFDWSLFQTQIPAYANPVVYPETTINTWWTTATNYISDIGNFGALQDGARAYAINLMTAHLIYISNLIASGTVPYLIQKSTIDKVSI